MNSIIKNLLLRPASWLYAGIVGVRNKLYDLDVLRTKETLLPSVGIGNLTVGGTGKTPHTEYLIELLHSRFKTAYLSRGYKRKSRGFVVAHDGVKPTEIGDEAYQIYTKFAHTTVAVDKDRYRGIAKLKAIDPSLQVVLLDDIYQHRAIRPDLNILLIDYNRPIYSDHILPFGNLREDAENTDRADIVIISKCPKDMQPVDMLSVRVQVNPFPYQNLYFTYLDYHKPKSINGGQATELTGFDILAVTGISQPQHLYNHLKCYSDHIHHLSFPDHHFFTDTDIAHIVKQFELLNPEHRAIIITEKDRARLDIDRLPDEIRPHIYSIGIEVKFLFDMQDKFNAEVEKKIRSRI